MSFFLKELPKEETLRALIRRDAPLPMMEALYGMTGREYTGWRLVLEVPPAVGRPAEPDEATTHRVWRAWQPLLAGRALGENLGAAGAIVGALALGLADVDAVTVSMSRLTPQPLSLNDASLAILAAVVSNNLSKIAIGAAAGRGAFAIEIAVMALLCFVAGAAAYWLAVLVVPA